MFKLIKSFSGEWFLIPFESPGITLIGFLIIGLLTAKFFELSGPAIIIPILLAFVVPMLVYGICKKLYMSPFWLCILHGVFIRKFIDAVSKNAITGNPQGLGLINIILLFVMLILACAFLISIATDNGFPIFFVIIITNVLYFLSAAIYEIGVISQIVFYSTIVQVIIAVIAQILLIRESIKNKKEQ